MLISCKLSHWLASIRNLRSIVMPFYLLFFKSPLLEMNSSRSSSILDSIFSRYFNLFRILVSSLIVEVAAVYGLCAIEAALPFIMSFNKSFYYYDTGSFETAAPEGPP